MVSGVNTCPVSRRLGGLRMVEQLFSQRVGADTDRGDGRAQ